jgi:hypothetical protein
MFYRRKTLHHPQGMPPQHTHEEWLQKLSKSGPVCHYCKCDLTSATAVKEHLTPLCRGGSDKINNIVPACEPCNQMKAWRTEAEFVRDRPALLQRRTVIRGIYKPKPLSSLEERANEPGLLKKVVSERERISWSWRNPA